MALAEATVDEDRYLNVREAARFLGVSVPYMHQLRTIGGGPSFKKVSAKIVRYSRADLIAWMEAKTCRSTAEYAEAAR